jgi:hypothetical protein
MMNTGVAQELFNPASGTQSTPQGKEFSGKEAGSLRVNSL